MASTTSREDAGVTEQETIWGAQAAVGLARRRLGEDAEIIGELATGCVAEQIRTMPRADFAAVRALLADAERRLGP